jgi:hypothetical protein
VPQLVNLEGKFVVDRIIPDGLGFVEKVDKIGIHLLVIVGVVVVDFGEVFDVFNSCTPLGAGAIELGSLFGEDVDGIVGGSAGHGDLD